MSVSAEMPKYKCHKEVWALKLEGVRVYIDAEGEHFELYPEDKRYAAISVEQDWFDKHKPEKGGYYVVYEGGYASYSPADSFEKGYSLIK